MSQNIIELRNICYRYPGRETPVLKNLDLTVGEERIGLIGANGSGKTTLFQIMVGLLVPESGQVFQGGQQMQGEKDFRLLRRKVGFLFQSADDQLFSPTVIEDVAFGPLNLGHSPDEAASMAKQVLADLGLAGFEERVTHRLSGGEKKLVALATILVMKPRLLLLDEPTNNLDPVTRKRLMEILRGLRQSYIIISHDWDFLAATTSRLYALEHGQLHHYGHDHLHTHQHLHPYGDHPHQHGG